MDILPNGNRPAPPVGSLVYLYKYVKGIAQKITPKVFPERWSHLRRATAMIGIVTIFFAVPSIVTNFKIKKIIESYKCTNEHKPHLLVGLATNLPEYSPSCQVKETLLNLSLFLLITTVTEAFAGVVLIRGALERSRLWLNIWALLTFLWITSYIVISMFIRFNHITAKFVPLILGPASIVTVLGSMALYIVLLYKVELLPEENGNYVARQRG